MENNDDSKDVKTLQNYSIDSVLSCGSNGVVFNASEKTKKADKVIILCIKLFYTVPVKSFKWSIMY